MKNLKDILEGLLDSDFDDSMDTKLLGELDKFINILGSVKLNHANPEVYQSSDQKLCDAAEAVAWSKKFKKISQSEAKKMITRNEPGTVLSVNWTGMGSHEWNLIDTATGEYMHVGCILKHEHHAAPWTGIYPRTIQPGREFYALGRGGTDPCYIFPAGIYDYFKKVLEK